MEAAVRRSLSATACAGTSDKDEFFAVFKGCLGHSMGLQRLSLYVCNVELRCVYLPNPCRRLPYCIGQRALMLATQSKHLEVTKLLLATGMVKIEYIQG